LDVALRNAVFRERDGSVLWIDFEFSKIYDDDFLNNKIFKKLVKKEMELLEESFGATFENDRLFFDELRQHQVSLSFNNNSSSTNQTQNQSKQKMIKKDSGRKRKRKRSKIIQCGC